MANVSEILKKDVLTGEEVGQVLVATAVHSIAGLSNNDQTELISQEDFNKLRDSLKAEEDKRAYSIYGRVYNFLIDYYNNGVNALQQGLHGHYRNTLELSSCLMAEEDAKRDAERPIILTAYQYSKYQRKAHKRLCEEELSLKDLFFRILRYCINNPEKAPESITEAIEATKKESLTNEGKVQAYIKLRKLGYYKTKDGLISSDMTPEEWKKTVLEDYLHYHTLKINGKPASPEETIKSYQERRARRVFALAYNGTDGFKDLLHQITGRDVEQDLGDQYPKELVEDSINRLLTAPDSLERIINRTPPSFPLQEDLDSILDDARYKFPRWEFEKHPEGVPKFEVLLRGKELYGDSLDFAKDYKEFKEDFPKVYSSIQAFIRENIPSYSLLIASGKDVPEKDRPYICLVPFFLCGDLAKLDLLNFKSYTVPKDKDIIKEYLEDDNKEEAGPSDAEQAQKRSLAVIENPLVTDTDTSGNYAGPGRNPYKRTLESLAEDEPAIQALTFAREGLVIPTLKYINKINALIDIFGSLYDIEGINSAKIDIGYLEYLIDGANGLIHVLYCTVQGDKQEKAHKREIIKKLFPPVYFERFKPSKEAISKVKRKLKKLGYTAKAEEALTDIDGLLSLLAEEE